MRFLLAILLLLPTLAGASEADIVDVTATQSSDGSWRFDVSVKHDDEGWDHYADKWEVLTPDGELLGERVLLHPHENEQPFTRSQSGIVIPDDLTEVVIRAHDSVHEWGGAERTISLPR